MLLKSSDHLADVDRTLRLFLSVQPSVNVPGILAFYFCITFAVFLVIVFFIYPLHGLQIISEHYFKELYPKLVQFLIDLYSNGELDQTRISHLNTCWDKNGEVHNYTRSNIKNHAGIVAFQGPDSRHTSSPPGIELTPSLRTLTPRPLTL